MTLNELLIDTYQQADANAQWVLGASVGLPVVGSLLALIGKGGKTDADGRFIASAVMAVAMLAVGLEVLALFLAHSLLGLSPLDANALLLVAPVLCLGGSVVGIRLVFPLSELGSVRTMMDLGVFLVACAGVLWLLSRFRGWGVVFFGGFMQLVVVGVLILFFLRRLFRRASGLAKREAP